MNISRIIKAATKPVAGSENNSRTLETAISLDEYFTGSTRMKANTHYPVDWVLLRDATKTLIKAINDIRKHGLKNRMNEPSDFINEINKLCINMIHTKGKKDSKKKSNQIFRTMMKKMTLHGLRHQGLLANRWQETYLSEEETNQIIARVEFKNTLFLAE